MEAESMETQRDAGRSRACQPCKIVHLSCNHERPCRRCIKRGLQDQCMATRSYSPGPRTLLSMNPALVARQRLARAAASPRAFDHTGQTCPVGKTPRVTATLWEDQGSLVFHVEWEGITVSRREDNHMINGTRLLNVAGRSRGTRETILNAVVPRDVVKNGPTRLQGVWIPFERALELANQHKITEDLYPLFVQDLGALLYHPVNQMRTPSAPSAPPLVASRGSAICHLLNDVESLSLQDHQPPSPPPPPSAHFTMEGIEASHPTAVQDYELQLRLEQQNKSDPFAFTQEKDQLWEGSWLQAYQNRLMLLQQKNKQRLMKRKETDQESRREVKSQDQLIQSLLHDQETMKRMLAGREQEEQKKAGGLGSHLEALKLEEQQDTKRRSNTEDEEKLPAPPANTNPQDYAMQLRSVEPQKMELRQEPRPKQEPWQNTRPSVEPNGVPVKVESQQPRELQTQGHPAMGRGEQSKPSRMTLEHSEMQFHYLTEAHKQTSTEPAWKPGNLQSEWKGIISKPTNEYSQRMDWEEILPGDVESPPSTPCMTPPESLSPTLPDPGSDCA